MPATRWDNRVDAGDWQSIAAAVDDDGGALLPRLLTPTEAKRLRNLYTREQLFRATIDMGLVATAPANIGISARPIRNRSST